MLTCSILAQIAYVDTSRQCIKAETIDEYGCACQRYYTVEMCAGMGIPIIFPFWPGIPMGNPFGWRQKNADGSQRK